MGKEGIVPVWIGSWMSSMLLLPIGLVITYRASIDKSFQGSNPLMNGLKGLMLRWKKRGQAKALVEVKSSEDER